MNKKDQNNLAYRRDNRTQKEFEKALKRDTEYEKVAALAIKTNLLAENKKVKVQNYGMDNSGALITNSNHVNAKPDFLFIIDDVDHYYEIKVHSDRYHCMTFKTSNIKSYIIQKAECIVVTESGYYILNEKAMRYMMKHCTPTSYPNFAGGKEAYRLTKAEVSALIVGKVVSRIYWNDPALKLLDKYKFIFERNK